MLRLLLKKLSIILFLTGSALPSFAQQATPPTVRWFPNSEHFNRVDNMPGYAPLLSGGYGDIYYGLKVILWTPARIPCFSAIDPLYGVPALHVGVDASFSPDCRSTGKKWAHYDYPGGYCPTNNPAERLHFNIALPLLRKPGKTQAATRLRSIWAQVPGLENTGSHFSIGRHYPSANSLELPADEIRNDGNDGAFIVPIFRGCMDELP